MAFENNQKAFLRARANSIEGGTSEIMKNILGERSLGLPVMCAPTRTSVGARSHGTELASADGPTVRLAD